MDNTLLDLRSLPGLQQPEWGEPERLRDVQRELENRPPLTSASDVRELRALLATVAAGEAQVIQAGDCSEDPAECTRGYIARKSGLLDVLAGVLKMITHRPVLRVGRIAGQFGKPRSKPTERFGDVEMPVYRGHMVNSPEPDPELRKPDPGRLLAGYEAANEAMFHLGWMDPGRRQRPCPPVWASHEALLLAYEIPMVRRSDDGDLMLSSTHWPWIGERTRNPDGAHVNLLSCVINPLGCKVGRDTSIDQVLTLCEVLDPRREPGRLTLIARMGVDGVADRLPPLVRAVREAGHPVIWMTDPMHANTVAGPDGLKTRFLETVVREVEEFQVAVRGAGGVAGGLHLETTPDEVTECVTNVSEIDHVGDKYTSFCDPRLNPTQAISVVSAWRS
jgi:3-deoxy-7-phosphoheptulonate synthase